MSENRRSSPYRLDSFGRSLLRRRELIVLPGYDAARSLPNALINRRPAVIARCIGAADAIACVRFAREHDVLVAGATVSRESRFAMAAS